MVDHITSSTPKQPNYTYTVDPRTMTKLLIVLLWINVGAATVVGLSDLIEYGLLKSQFTEAQLQANDTRQVTLSLIWLVYSVFLGVVFLRWIYRANKNSHGFGAEGMKFSPGWSVGYYFIPLLNLYQPFRAMREIMQVSRNPDNWREQQTGSLVYIWWTLWLLCMYLGILPFKMPTETVDDYIWISLVGLFSDCTEIILSMVAIFLVKRIAWGQERLVEGKI